MVDHRYTYSFKTEISVNFCNELVKTGTLGDQTNQWDYGIELKFGSGGRD